MVAGPLVLPHIPRGLVHRHAAKRRAGGMEGEPGDHHRRGDVVYYD